MIRSLCFHARSKARFVAQWLVYISSTSLTWVIAIYSCLIIISPQSHERSAPSLTLPNTILLPILLAVGTPMQYK